jgi:hypothetical protein
MYLRMRRRLMKRGIANAARWASQTVKSLSAEGDTCTKARYIPLEMRIAQPPNLLALYQNLGSDRVFEVRIPYPRFGGTRPMISGIERSRKMIEGIRKGCFDM